jgi:formylglycine-generating enzyme required for sulfatase activity
VLERRAFEAHAAQQGRDGTADIPASALNNDLLFIKRRDTLPASAAGEAPPPTDARKLNEYLRERVGILHQRGGSDERDAVYSFPHRSFQELLAAVYLSRDEAALYERFPAANSDNWVDLAAWLARTDPDRWREVVLLSAGHHADKAPAWDLAKALYPEPEPEPPANLTPEDAWGLRLAAEVLAECLPQENLKPGNRRARERVRRDLPRLLAASTLPSAERVTAGLHLARLGDPRPGALTLDAMEFCRVPAGRCFLGAPDDEGWLDAKTGAGPHRIEYGYWLARWPLTVAQWRAYLAAAGREAEHADSLRAAANTPVVYVSWHEAMACADWLTGHWQARGLLPAGWRVTLPSEPEWEQAAKGGERIPAPGAALIRPLAEIATDIDGDPALIQNPEPRRRYPWGDAPDAERMNIEMDIGRVSPVGCYAAGASPYGCEELSGNVWEWTRSRSEPYPYPEDAAGRAARENPSGPARRVFRGGAFNNNRRHARCSYRLDLDPDYRSNNAGLRLCLSPSIFR